MGRKIELSKNHNGWLLVLDACEKGSICVLGKKWNVVIDYKPNSSFKNNKFYKEDDDLVLLFDGVVFDYGAQVDGKEFSIAALKDLYTRYGVNFADKISGSFSGFLIDKLRNRVIVFSDYIGSRAVFYAQYDNRIIFSSDIASIYDLLETLKLTKTLDKDAVYSLLGNGYMYGNMTLVQEVKRLVAGCVITIDDYIKEIPYYQIDNTPDRKISESDAVELIDKLFISAIKAQYDSDLKGGINTHLVALSGGLDSRMTSLIAHKLGYTAQLNYTVSKSGYLDQTIPQHIASEYNHDWIFKSLDTANFLNSYDEIIEYTGGYELYYGMAHVWSLQGLIDLGRFGILHSGMLGDVVIGTYYQSSNPNEKYSIWKGVFYPNKLLSKVSCSLPDYANEEVGIFYNRGVNCMLYAAHTLIQQKIETYSPFLYRPFFDAMLKLPLDYRRDHRIYKKWILERHPEFAKFKWEKINARIDDRFIKIFGRTAAIGNIPDIIIRKITGDQGGENSSRQMTPMAWSLSRNKSLAEHLNTYIKNNIGLIDDKEIRQDAQWLLENGNIYDHNKLIALLTAIKRFDIH